MGATRAHVHGESTKNIAAATLFTMMGCNTLFDVIPYSTYHPFCRTVITPSSSAPTWAATPPETAIMRIVLTILLVNIVGSNQVTLTILTPRQSLQSGMVG